jgi:dehydrogenase/reductase SDR family member 12
MTGLPAAIDTMLDRTIALGYGNIGLVVRRHLAGWPADPPRMDGKTVLVTGAASGIGLAACSPPPRSPPCSVTCSSAARPRE